MASLAGALKVLRAFDGTSAATIDSISEITAISVLKTRHLVDLLEKLGYLAVRADTVSLELATLNLGFAARPLTLASIAKRPLGELAKSTGATVSLGALVNDEVMFLVRIRNSDLMAANIAVGSTIPAGASLIGRLLLAFASEEELTPYFAATGVGSTMTPAFNRELANIRRDGYAASGHDGRDPLFVISVPVLKPDGLALAAINLAVASAVGNRNFLLSEILAAAANISEQARNALLC
jgi:IclR family transcriptional regulator, pca regulon regulatory protein